MRRALSVGIDQYSFGALRGCVSDAMRIDKLLRTNHDGSRNFDCKVLLAPSGGPDTSVTRVILRERITELFSAPADVALLYFSGHGTVNDLDGYLCTQDAIAYDVGVTMGEILKLANNSQVKEVVVILDCCFAGNFGNMPDIDNARATLREGISILTASRGDQPSLETEAGGVFTSLLADALDGGAADILGKVSATAIYAYIEAALGAWHQRPLFKAHVTQVLPLRYCKAPIDKAILLRLPTLFTLPAEDIQLDPTFEPKSNNPNINNVAIFEDLQSLNRVFLVTPVDAKHMYDAAMQSKACRLTPTGRYYWRLANDGRL